MKQYSYTCIRNKQRPDHNAPEFLLFSAKSREIFEWAAIERYTADSKKGPQRLPKKAKVAEIHRFLERDQRNTIPTTLLVSLNVLETNLTPIVPNRSEIVSLAFVCDDQANPPVKAGMVVDGQHRLLGVMEFQPDLHLNVVAMINASDDETAFQFLVVNNKASRVSNNHLRALALNFEEDELSKRLHAVRMSISQHLDFVGLVDTEPQSPFRGIIDWPNNPPERGLVAPNAIESCIAYLKQKRITELDDDAILLVFFLAIWTQITEKGEGQVTLASHLLEKVPIICLTQFLADNIIFEYDNDEIDLTDFKAVAESVEHVIDSINPKFWEAKWSAKSLDTAAGRNLLLDSLTQMR